ncbi:unnamed protein product [Linum trigynum]|uniref:Uncharacterized protein n=1 Tax=Linum trigynum TaxID=586398 RepID=A0AAV2D021_9ROSI
MRGVAMAPVGADAESETLGNPCRAGQASGKQESRPRLLPTPPGLGLMEARVKGKAPGYEGEPMFGDSRGG